MPIFFFFNAKEKVYIIVYASKRCAETFSILIYEYYYNNNIFLTTSKQLYRVSFYLISFRLKIVYSGTVLGKKPRYFHYNYITASLKNYAKMVLTNIFVGVKYTLAKKTGIGVTVWTALLIPVDAGLICYSELSGMSDLAPNENRFCSSEFV